MYALEVIFVLITSVLLVALNSRRTTRRTRVLLFAAGLVVAVLAIAIGQARIHMMPAAIIFAILSFLQLRRDYSHIAVRAVGVFVGLAVVAASVALALALPVVVLPAPDGPHTVGVTSFTVVDESRDESAFGAPGRSREIYVQVWYPGAIPEDGPAPRVRTLWEELYRPPVFDVLFGYLGGMKTHSYENVPLSKAQDSYPAIVFSPSLSGIAEQNTLLMEHLASHGYIVFGVTHPHFGMFTTYSDGSGVPVSNKVMEAMSEQGSIDLDDLAVDAKQAGGSVERAGIWLEYFERGTMLSEFIDICVRDLRLLLDTITMPSTERSTASAIIGRIDTGRLGFLGMSYGGAAVTELCKTDTRCRATINLDGGLWGSHIREPLMVPYLVLASPDNRKFFQHDLLISEAPYYAVTVEGARHTNFTDVSAFVPLFKWIGVTGPIEGQRVIEIMNRVSRRFFDAYLRGAGEPTFESAEFPELSIETNQSL